MTRVLPRLQTCFQFIYLFIYLCIFSHLPPRRRRLLVLVILVVVVTGFLLKRLFASVATVCLEVGALAVKHHRFFLEYYTAILSLIPRK